MCWYWCSGAKWLTNSFDQLMNSRISTKSFAQKTEKMVLGARFTRTWFIVQKSEGRGGNVDRGTVLTGGRRWTRIVENNFNCLVGSSCLATAIAWTWLLIGGRITENANAVLALELCVQLDNHFRLLLLKRALHSFWPVKDRFRMIHWYRIDVWLNFF